MRKHKRHNSYLDVPPVDVGRRAHGIWTHVRPLTPKEQAALGKRIAAGIYANAH